MFIQSYPKGYCLRQNNFVANKARRGDINLCQGVNIAFFSYRIRAPPR